MRLIKSIHLPCLIDPGIDWPGYRAEKPIINLLSQEYDVNLGKWRDASLDHGGVNSDRITILTWNTWFQQHYWNLRHAAIVSILKESNADFVVLQEVNVQLLDKIHADEWIQNQYYSVHSNFRIDSIPTHGLVLLSKFPLNEAVLYPLPTHMGRSLLVAKLRINQQVFSVATVHLESMNNSRVRGEQLAKIFALLNAVPNILLAGDFNFCASWTEENQRLDPSYLDLWAILRPSEPGSTRDPEINQMLYHAKGKQQQVRIDRILLRSETSGSCWKPESIQLVGTSPVDPKHRKIFPSDHFGLLASLA